MNTLKLLMIGLLVVAPAGCGGGGRGNRGLLAGRELPLDRIVNGLHCRLVIYSAADTRLVSHDDDKVIALF